MNFRDCLRLKITVCWSSRQILIFLLFFFYALQWSSRPPTPDSRKYLPLWNNKVDAKHLASGVVSNVQSVIKLSTTVINNFLSNSRFHGIPVAKLVIMSRFQYFGEKLCKLKNVLLSWKCLKFFEKQPKTMMPQIDAAAVHAASLIHDDAPKQTWRWRQFVVHYVPETRRPQLRKRQTSWVIESHVYQDVSSAPHSRDLSTTVPPIISTTWAVQEAPALRTSLFCEQTTVISHWNKVVK